MLNPLHHDKKQGNQVFLGDDGIIHLVFVGEQTTANTAPIYEQTKQLIGQQRAAEKRVLMLGDVTGITKQDSGSRVQAKKLMALDYDANAIVGKSALMPIIMYVMRAGKHGRIKAFRSRRQATSWLMGEESQNISEKRQIIGFVLGLLGAGILTGWFTDTEVLFRGYLSFPPVRPIAAIGFIMLSLALFAEGKLRWMRPTFGYAAAALGVLMLLPEHTTHMAHWLFSHAVDQHNVGFMPAATAWSFLFSGLLIALWSAHNKATDWARILFGYSVFFISILNLIAYLYTPAFLHQFGQYFTSAPTVSVLFILFLSGIDVQRKRKAAPALTQTSWISFAIILAIFGVQVLTAISWRDTQDRTRQKAGQVFNARVEDTTQAINNRLRTYTDALYGFRGLFNSSSAVSEKEFTTYYEALNLKESYPGFTAISFIQNVKAAELHAFTQQVKDDRSLHPEGNPAFKISASSDENFVLRYVAGGRGSGLNLATDQARRNALIQARDSGQPAASGTVVFPATSTQPERKGFIITIPLYKQQSVPTTQQERQQASLGFVNAVFDYSVLFNNVLSHAEGYEFEIFDNAISAALNKPIYSDDDKIVNQAKAQDLRTEQVEVVTAGRPWTIVAKAPTNFGIDDAQESLAKTIIWGGNVLTLFLVFVLWLEVQSRRRAMALADAMTQDLNSERNNAIAIQHKDEALLSSIGDGVFAIDRTGKIILFNRVASEISGYTEAEAIGTPYSQILQFINESNNTAETHFIDQALEGKNGTMSKHAAIVNKTGARIPVADSAAPIIDAKGEHVGVIVVFRDVTHERQLEQAKDEFVSLVSHQLRTPLTAIRLFVEMVLDEQVGKLNAGQRDYLSKVDTSTNRMIQLVGDFLNTSRIELGRLRVEPSPTKLEELVQSHINEVQPLADQKQVTIKYSARKLPEVSVDPSLYGQVIHNLLTNAIRYTKNGGNVSVSLQKNSKGYQLDVSDNGIGIPKDAQGKLFQRFFRADNAIKVEGEGSGLGLYLIKKIVELSHGKIWFESTEGKGTTFHVIIPERGMKAKAGAANLK